LSGGADNDMLSGGRGDDFLMGGSGADTFSFFASGGHDTVQDFNGLLGDKVNLANTTYDFTNWVDVFNHGYNYNGGCVINTGGGDSINFVGVSLDQVYPYVMF
jgi:surface adhesion protein